MNYKKNPIEIVILDNKSRIKMLENSNIAKNSVCETNMYIKKKNKNPLV